MNKTASSSSSSSFSPSHAIYVAGFKFELISRRKDGRRLAINFGFDDFNSPASKPRILDKTED